MSDVPPNPSMSTVMSAAALAAHLNALPLYVQLRAGGAETDATPLAETQELWPGWRARFRAANPAFREGQADVGLLNAAVWALAAAQFGTALTLGRAVHLGARLAWPEEAPYPFSVTVLGDVVPGGPVPGDACADLCAEAVAALVADAEALRPGTVLGGAAFWNTVADRSLQALLLAGSVSGRVGEARAWAARLPELWPRPTRARVLDSPVDSAAAAAGAGEGVRVVRASCCFRDHYAGGFARCDNCPLERRSREADEQAGSRSSA